ADAVAGSGIDRQPERVRLRGAAAGSDDLEGIVPDRDVCRDADRELTGHRPVRRWRHEGRAEGASHTRWQPRARKADGAAEPTGRIHRAGARAAATLR